MVTKGITNGTEFTWYVKVTPEMADIKRVRVGAFFIDLDKEADGSDPDGTDGDTPSGLKTSDAKTQISVDGDRPTNPSSGVAFQDAGVKGTGMGGSDLTGGLEATDTRNFVFGKLVTEDVITSPGRRKGQPVTGFTGEARQWFSASAIR